MQRLLFLAVRLRVAAALILAVPTFAAGCAASSDTGSAADAADAAVAGEATSTATVDAAGGGGGGERGADSTPAGVFVLGTNTTGKSTPDQFTALPKGAELNVELGPQGLWMVVLAFQTRDLVQPPLVMTGRVEIDGELLGELKLGKQKLLPGPAGMSYYYNFFLVVAPEGVAAKTAIIHFSVEDVAGPKVSMQHPVLLTGGT